MTANDRDLELILRSTPPRAFSTGLRALDALTGGGPRAGHLVVFGGLTGHGKSSLARQVALSLSIDDDVLYVTLEEPRDEVLVSFGAKLARTSVDAFRRTGLDIETAALLRARKLHVHEPKRGLDISGFEALMRKTKCAVVILDHLREMNGWIADGTGRGAGHVGPALITQRLQLIAKETGKLLIVLQQLNPPKHDARPTEYDLMDGKMLAQKAYLVALLWRPFIGNDGRGEKSDWITEILVRKNRYGRPGRLHYRWVGETGMLWELSAEERENVACCAPKKPRAAAP